MFNLTSLLEQQGNTVIPFSCLFPENISHSFDRYFVSPIITAKTEFGRQGWRTTGRFLWSVEAAHALDRLLTDHPVDIAHLHNIYHHLSPSILPVLRKHSVPMVMTLHDFHLVSPVYGLYADGIMATYIKGGKFWRAVPRRAVKRSFAASALCALELTLHRALKIYEKYIDVFIAPSRFMADTIQEWGFRPSHIEILPNFIDPQSYDATAPSGEVILYVGRLSEEKGIGLLMEVVRRMPDTRFVVAGTGPEEFRVRDTLVSVKNLDFLGRVPLERIPKLYANAALVIVPTVGVEVFPMVVQEAFAAGRPVVASKVGGIPELVEEGITGSLVERDDAEGFVMALRTLLADRAKLQKMGHNARLLVEKKYSPESHYQALMKIYNSILS